ncbi:MAG: glycosyltransferase [Clostridia bacterium]|nr:glycosyltransferase [Clostridia bacterium]
MIKIMQVLTDSNIGGAGIWLINLLQNYNRSEYEIIVVLPSQAVLLDRIRALDVRTITAESIADRSFSSKAVSELTHIIKREKPDIIHTHASLSARIAAKKCRVPVVHTRHCLEPRKSFPKNLIYSFVNNLLSSRVIAVSQAVSGNLIRDGIKEDKLSVIYNGITPLTPPDENKKAEARKRFGIPPEAITVGLTARLEEVKNPLLFVRSAKILADKFPDVYFLLVGEGSLRSKVEEEAAPISDRFILTGYISDIEKAYSAMDILTLTSDSEALSISILEGQSAGLPVISTDSGGPAEIITPGLNGLIVPTNNPKSLAAAAEELIRSPEMRRSFGEAGRERVMKKFTAEYMARKTEAIYEELAKSLRKEQK